MGAWPPQPPQPPTGGYPPAPPPGGGYGPPPPSPAAGGPLRPMTLSDVLDGMFRIVVRNLRTIGLTLPVIALPIALLVSWLQRESLGGLGLTALFNNPTAFTAAMEASRGPLFWAMYS